MAVSQPPPFSFGFLSFGPPRDFPRFAAFHAQPSCSTSRQHAIRERVGFYLRLAARFGMRERERLLGGKGLHLPCARRHHRHEQSSSVDSSNLFPPLQDLARQSSPLRALAVQHPVRRFRPTSVLFGSRQANSPVNRNQSNYYVVLGYFSRFRGHGAAVSVTSGVSAI